MEYHCAGSANDPNFADAEAVLDDLAINLPDVVVIKHMKSPVRASAKPTSVNDTHIIDNFRWRHDFRVGHTAS